MVRSEYERYRRTARLKRAWQADDCLRGQCKECLHNCPVAGAAIVGTRTIQVYGTYTGPPATGVANCMPVNTETQKKACARTFDALGI